MRARPERIRIESGGSRADVDPAAMPPDVSAALARLLDETRAPAPSGAEEPGAGMYDVVLEYGDGSERLRYTAEELPPDVRAALDALLGRSV